MSLVRLVAFLAGLVALPGLASAQLYFGAQGGLSFTTTKLDAELSGFGGNEIEFDLDPGSSAGAMVGYRVRGDEFVFRFEGEATYQLNNVDDITVNGISTNLVIDGDVDAVLLMANMWIDWPVRTPFVIPYVGGGIGAAIVDINDLNATVTGFGPVNVSDRTDTTFAAQLGGGLAIAFTSRFAVTVDYRFLWTPGIDVEPIEMDYMMHSIRAGVRFTL